MIPVSLDRKIIPNAWPNIMHLCTLKALYTSGVNLVWKLGVVGPKSSTKKTHSTGLRISSPEF